MKDFVSGINAVLVSSVLITMAGILVADLPWGAFIFVSGAAALALWKTPRTPTRSIAQLFRDLEAVPVRAVAPARGVSSAPRATL
jgi:hypothetical protein